MKIGNPTDKAIGGTSGAKTESATSTKSSGRTTSLDGGVSSSAKVTLSSAATNLITTVDPTFDSDKVASVKQSIEDGSYQISATGPLYRGPGAPATGPLHHYVFELYALSTNLDLPATSGRDALLKAMEGKIVAKAAYVGRYRSGAQ